MADPIAPIHFETLPLRSVELARREGATMDEVIDFLVQGDWPPDAYLTVDPRVELNDVTVVAPQPQECTACTNLAVFRIQVGGRSHLDEGLSCPDHVGTVLAARIQEAVEQGFDRRNVTHATLNFYLAQEPPSGEAVAD